MNSARAFLAGIVDYAGLFPPASLDMHGATTVYAVHKTGADRDLLGRFILPASRLVEFASEVSRIPSLITDPWRLSVTAKEDLDAVVASIDQFDCPGAVVDAIEVPVGSVQQVRDLTRRLPDRISLFLEVPLGAEMQSIISAIAGTEAHAKVRTGGVVASAIPSPGEVLAFMRACTNAGVAFKATAGLHHAIRGNYPLTYEQDSPRGVMHGFLNVFIAAAFCTAHDDRAALSALEETDAAAFRFDERGAWWRDSVAGPEILAATRRKTALSFGSCSFDEPVLEARHLHLI